MKALFCLILAAIVLSGCGLLESASPRVERLDCQVRALEPLAGDLYDTRALLLDVYAGKADLGAVLGALKATPAEVEALVNDLRNCEPPVKFPEGEPS